MTSALLATIQLLSVLVPQAYSFITMIIHPDGTSTVLVTIANVEAANTEAMTAIQKLQALVGTAAKKA